MMKKKVKALEKKTQRINFLNENPFNSYHVKLLADIVEKVESKTRFNFLFFYKKFRKENSGKKPSIKDYIKSIPYFNTPLCSKCRWAVTCPFYGKNLACYFIGEILRDPKSNLDLRDIRIFTIKLKHAINYVIKHSTVFKENPLEIHLKIMLFLISFYFKCYLDIKEKNKRINYELKSAKQNTPLGKPKINTQYKSMEEYYNKIRDRHKILGIDKDLKFY